MPSWFFFDQFFDENGFHARSVFKFSFAVAQNTSRQFAQPNPSIAKLVRDPQAGIQITPTLYTCSD